MSLCPEHNDREAMTDDEFWQYVFGRTPEEEKSWAEYHWAMEGPDVWVIDCIRCGRTVEIPEGQRHTRERDASTGYRGYEVSFITCSNKCRENARELFIKWLGTLPGWNKEKATENFDNYIKTTHVHRNRL